MSKVPDRQKQRREYLWKKGSAHMRLTFFRLSEVFFGLLIVTCTAFALFCGTGEGFFIFTGLALASYYVLRVSVREDVRAERDATIPYVPPVTPSTLPAEEVLVRGARQPNAPQETLLRAAHAHEDPAPSQLLRVVGGATEKPTGS